MQLTSVLMLVTTVIGIISLVVIFFVFHPNWPGLAFIAMMVTASTGEMVLLLVAEETNRKKALREENEDVSDRL